MSGYTDGKLTIDEVARLCDVSKTTISRFLNGKYGNMSAETRERIAAEIKKLDYRPNRTAQRLKASRSMLIGCVIADVSSPFSALLLKGITNVCEKNGYQVLFADTGESIARETRAIEGFLENRVDGLIVNTCGGNDEYLLSLRDRGIPTVLADRELTVENQMDTVAAPNLSSAAECTAFLFDRGYENVAFFSTTIGCVSPRLLRCRGYVQEYKRRYPARVPEIFEFSADSAEECRSAIKDFLGNHFGEKNAILSANGNVAQHILAAANVLGLAIGTDFGFCTFDDWTWLQIAKPPITAVSLASAKIGEQAAELLMWRMNGESEGTTPKTVIVPAYFIERGSA